MVTIGLLCVQDLRCTIVHVDLEVFENPMQVAGGKATSEVGAYPPPRCLLLALHFPNQQGFCRIGNSVGFRSRPHDFGDRSTTGAERIPLIPAPLQQLQYLLLLRIRLGQQ